MLSRRAATRRRRISPCPARDDDVLAETAVQHVGHRVGVGDDRDDRSGAIGAVRKVAIQEQPGVGALGLRRGERVLKREAALRQKCVPRRQNPRIPRLVQVQAARIVSRQQPEGLDRDRLVESREVQRLASLTRVGIVNDGQQRLDEELVAANARARIVGRRRAVAAERIDGNEDERGRRDHRHDKECCARAGTWRCEGRGAIPAATPGPPADGRAAA